MMEMLIREVQQVIPNETAFVSIRCQGYLSAIIACLNRLYTCAKSAPTRPAENAHTEYGGLHSSERLTEAV